MWKIAIKRNCNKLLLLDILSCFFEAAYIAFHFEEFFFFFIIFMNIKSPQPCSISDLNLQYHGILSCTWYKILKRKMLNCEISEICHSVLFTVVLGIIFWRMYSYMNNNCLFSSFLLSLFFFSSTYFYHWRRNLQ